MLLSTIRHAPSCDLQGLHHKCAVGKPTLHSRQKAGKPSHQAALIVLAGSLAVPRAIHVTRRCAAARVLHRRTCIVTAAAPASVAGANGSDAASSSKPSPRQLKVLGDVFELDGKPHRILSGSMSYFRMFPEQWRDRLEKLQGLGCNAVEVYVPWNLHQPSASGPCCFDHRLDIVGFLSLCREMELNVILRPGPYICAELDLGGLPAWLLNREDPVPLRSSDAEYMRCVEAWWLAELLPRVRPFASSNGGPIIAVQIENEFGYWGKEKAYLTRLRELLLEGFGGTEATPLLFTSDGTFFPDLQANGGLDGVLRMANFGSDAKQRLGELRQAQPTGPLVNMEFWVGWFDAWAANQGKSYRSAKDVAKTLQVLLDEGASVNFFVFHGGTSFGFCGAGANLDYGPGGSDYRPQVTSYDYGGLLDEAGEVTDKYLQCRAVLADFLGRPELLEKEWKRSVRLPSSPPLDLVNTMSLAEALPALQSSNSPTLSKLPLPAESIGSGYGYVLYRSQSPVTDRLPLQVGRDAVRDFASVMMDGEVLGTIYRNDNPPPPGLYHELSLPPTGGRLEILVDIMNRVNFGGAMRSQRKGLLGADSVTLGSFFTGPPRAVWGWENIPLSMQPEDMARLPWSTTSEGSARNDVRSSKRGPRFFRFKLFVREPADGFLDMTGGFVKGFVAVNGFNLGRYWQIGPQRSLYVPGPLLQRGENEVIVFDIDFPGGTLPSIRVVPEALWSSGVLPPGAIEAVSDSVSKVAEAIESFRRQ